MATNTVPQIYSWVIQDVVEKMSRKFAELGLDENVLTDLKQIWEDKIRKMGVAPFAPQDPFFPDPNFMGGYYVPQHDGADDHESVSTKDKTKSMTREQVYTVDRWMQ